MNVFNMSYQHVWSILTKASSKHSLTQSYCLVSPFQTPVKQREQMTGNHLKHCEPANWNQFNRENQSTSFQQGEPVYC